MTGAQGKSPLRFVTFLAPNMLPVYHFLVERISDRLGQPVELVVGTSFDQFERGEADLGVICGLPYVWLADRHPSPVEPLAAPVLSGARYGGRPIYYSDVIVRHDSPISCLEELRGHSWAYRAGLTFRPHRHPLQPGRHGRPTGLPRPGGRGRLSPARHPAGRGRRRGRGRHRLPSPGHRAPRPSTAGRRAAGDRLLRAVDQPVVASSGLPSRLKDQVRELLADLTDEPLARPVLDYGLIDRFTAVDDAAYDDIREMLATIEAAGWTSITQTVLEP